MKQHRIGIIAGSGPEAGIDLWKKVLEEHRDLLGDRYAGDVSAPEVVVISVPTLGYSMDLEQHDRKVWEALREAAVRIADQVDVYVIACNTLNFYADRLRSLRLQAVLLTPAEAAIAEVRRRGDETVALLGSRQTMDLEAWSSYRNLTQAVEVELPQDMGALHSLIESIKIAGGPTPHLEQAFADLRAELRSDTVLLACTELPLLGGLAAQESTGAIDVSRLLARAAVRWQPRNEAAGSKSAAGQTVSVIYTGGTFGMVDSPDGLVPTPSLRETVEKLFSDNGNYGLSARWTYSEVNSAIDSAELDVRGLGDLACFIREVAEREQATSVVVIHGTDTMAYSAAHAAFALPMLEIPIVFTGAQLPLGAPDSDAEDNFRLALSVATDQEQHGVSIAFGGKVLPAVRATKWSSESFAAFRAVRAFAGLPSVPPVKRLAAATARADEAPPRVGFVKVTPGLTASQLEAVLKECPDGIVLECYGPGTAPVASACLIEPIKDAVSRGTVVVAVTQCEHGSVSLERYAVGSQLAQAGAIDGGDMTPEAAFGKLVALVRAGWSPAELRELMGENMLGERS